MNFDDFLIFSFEDFVLLGVFFVVSVIVSGSLLHFAISEREYYKWSKQQTEKKASKRPRKTISAATKSAKTSKTPRPLRKARA